MLLIFYSFKNIFLWAIIIVISWTPNLFFYYNIFKTCIIYKLCQNTYNIILLFVNLVEVLLPPNCQVISEKKIVVIFSVPSTYPENVIVYLYSYQIFIGIPMNTHCTSPSHPNLWSLSLSLQKNLLPPSHMVDLILICLSTRYHPPPPLTPQKLWYEYCKILVDPDHPNWKWKGGLGGDTLHIHTLRRDMCPW